MFQSSEKIFAFLASIVLVVALNHCIIEKEFSRGHDSSCPAHPFSDPSGSPVHKHGDACKQVSLVGKSVTDLDELGAAFIPLNFVPLILLTLIIKTSGIQRPLSPLSFDSNYFAIGRRREAIILLNSPNAPPLSF